MAREIKHKFSNEKWDQVSKIDAQSTTHLEDDTGEGDVAILRMFEFAVNPEAFKQHTPTTQELFNYHHKQIELLIWKDGMKIMPEVKPRFQFNKKKTKYRIFIGAAPAKGHLLMEKPRTLSQIAHNIHPE